MRDETLGTDTDGSPALLHSVRTQRCEFCPEYVVWDGCESDASQGSAGVSPGTCLSHRKEKAQKFRSEVGKLGDQYKP